MSNANTIEIGSTVKVISRKSDLIGKVVAPGPSGSFGPSWVIEVKALFADFGPSYAQVDYKTFGADDLAVVA